MTEPTRKTLQYLLVSQAGLLAVLALGCEGALGASGKAPPGPSAGGGTSAVPELAEGVGVARVGLRRLTVTEIDNSIRDLLQDDSRPAARFLPEEILPPFDNDYDQQFVSTVLVESIEKLAEDVTVRLMQDVSRRDALIGCSPADPAAADATCLRQFITDFGRRILRRTMLEDDVDSFQKTAEDYIAREHNFYAGIEVALAAFLQHPAFLYRVEAGTPVTAQPGVFKLDDLEVATRLSYLIWGSTPSGNLLDVAQDGGLSSPSKIRDVAATMLDDPRASQTVDRFHALWLGYSVLPHEQALATSMRAETSALIARTFTNDEPWTNLFTATDTYVDATLAPLYGLGNRIEPVIPNSSPKAAFDSLFNGFAPTDPAGQAAAQLKLDKRKSILDLVDRTLGGIHGKLSVSDRVRLSQHWDEIRALETRLSAIAPTQGGSCASLADPGPDPDVGGASDDPTAVDINQGYSDEDARAGVLNRLLAMAMICDLSRVGTLMYTHFQSFMNAQAIVDRTINLHSVNHEGTAEDIALISAWHMKHFAELVTLLRDAPEGDGNVLDNSAVVYLNEGGEGDNPDRTDGSHATKGLVGLIAGRAGGLKGGVHLIAPAATNHPANLLISAMNAVGVATDTYGAISGPMPGLV